MRLTDRIYVAGHGGLVGSALVRALRSLGYANLLLRTRDELDLQDIAAVRELFESERPRYVFLAAARVGGILANSTYPADFIRENLLVQLSVIEAARHTGVDKLLFIGSSCIYPRNAPQPIREEYLLTGALEPTNEAYAIAKIAGIVMCQSYNRQYGTRFLSVMPTNLYGQGDNFHSSGSHVLPALVRRFHDATLAEEPIVKVWGSGTPRREFLHVDDMASASIHVMLNWGLAPDPAVESTESRGVNDIVNIGYGDDISIRELAEIIRDVVGYRGETVFDASMPDGMPRKLLDSSRLRASGWRPTVSLREGISRTYDWFVSNLGQARLGG